MRRISQLLASMALTVLFASGVALALNTIKCDSRDFCYGTDRRDLMKGNAGENHMYGRGKADVLKGFEGPDSLWGESGNDRLFSGPGGDDLVGGDGDDRLDGLESRTGTLDGGAGNDRLLGGSRGNGLDGGPGDDILKGNKGGDVYLFLYGRGDDLGDDTIVDTEVPAESIFEDNQVAFRRPLPVTDPEPGDALIVNLNSDSGPTPEVSYGTSAVNWSGDVVDNVGNHLLTDDRIVGNDAANRIFSLGPSRPFGAPPPENPDGDTVLAAGGNDYISVYDGDGDDTVSCGAGTDEVTYNEGDELVVPDECETKDLRQ